MLAGLFFGLLVGLKLWALGATGALSVAASLADSAMDLMVSLGAMAALVYAAKPADEDHAFGHTSAEDLAALGQALFILISAGAIDNLGGDVLSWLLATTKIGGNVGAVAEEQDRVAVDGLGHHR